MKEIKEKTCIRCKTETTNYLSNRHRVCNDCRDGECNHKHQTCKRCKMYDTEFESSRHRICKICKSMKTCKGCGLAQCSEYYAAYNKHNKQIRDSAYCLDCRRNNVPGVTKLIRATLPNMVCPRTRTRKSRKCNHCGKLRHIDEFVYKKKYCIMCNLFSPAYSALLQDIQNTIATPHTSQLDLEDAITQYAYDDDFTTFISKAVETGLPVKDARLLGKALDNYAEATDALSFRKEYLERRDGNLEDFLAEHSIPDISQFTGSEEHRFTEFWREITNSVRTDETTLCAYNLFGGPECGSVLDYDINGRLFYVAMTKPTRLFESIPHFMNKDNMYLIFDYGDTQHIEKINRIPNIARPLEHIPNKILHGRTFVNREKKRKFTSKQNKFISENTKDSQTEAKEIEMKNPTKSIFITDFNTTKQVQITHPTDFVDIRGEGFYLYNGERVKSTNEVPDGSTVRFKPFTKHVSGKEKVIRGTPDSIWKDLQDVKDIAIRYFVNILGEWKYVLHMDEHFIKNKQIKQVSLITNNGHKRIVGTPGEIMSQIQQENYSTIGYRGMEQIEVDDIPNIEWLNDFNVTEMIVKLSPDNIEWYRCVVFIDNEEQAWYPIVSVADGGNIRDSVFTDMQAGELWVIGSIATSLSNWMLSHFHRVNIKIIEKIPITDLRKLPMSGIPMEGEISKGCVASALYTFFKVKCKELGKQWDMQKIETTLREFQNPDESLTVEKLVQWRDKYVPWVSLLINHPSLGSKYIRLISGNAKYKFVFTVFNGHLFYDGFEAAYLPNKDYIYTDDFIRVAEDETFGENQTVCMTADMNALYARTITATGLISREYRIRNGKVVAFKHPERNVYYEYADEEYSDRKDYLEKSGIPVPWANQSWGTLGALTLKFSCGLPIPGEYCPNAYKFFEKLVPIPLVQGQLEPYTKIPYTNPERENWFAKRGLEYQEDDAHNPLKCIDMKRAYCSVIAKARNIPIPARMDEPREYDGEEITNGYYSLNAFQLFGITVPAMLWPDAAIREMLHLGWIDRNNIKYAMRCETRTLKHHAYKNLLCVDKRVANPAIGTFAKRTTSKSTNIMTTHKEDIQYALGTLEQNENSSIQYNVIQTMLDEEMQDIYLLSHNLKTQKMEGHQHLRAYVVAMANLEVLKKAGRISKLANIEAVKTDAIYYRLLTGYDEEKIDSDLWRSQDVDWNNVPDHPQYLRSYRIMEDEGGDFRWRRIERGIYHHIELPWEKVTDLSKPRVLCTGSAGSGKTTLMAERAIELAEEGKTVYIIATTHQACTAARDKLVEMEASEMLGIQVATVCSFFGLMATTFQNLPDCDALLIDEIAMLDPKALSALITRYKGEILYGFGDFRQCQAVEANSYYNTFESQMFKELFNYKWLEKEYIMGANRYLDDGTREDLEEFHKTGIVPADWINRFPEMTRRNICYTNKLRKEINSKFILYPGDLMQFTLPSTKVSELAKKGILNRNLVPYIREEEKYWIVDNSKYGGEGQRELRIPKTWAEPGFCITAHSIQGHKIEEKYTIYADGMSKNELYTAMSRCISKYLVSIKLKNPFRKFHRRRNKILIYDLTTVDTKEIKKEVRPDVDFRIIEEHGIYYVNRDAYADYDMACEASTRLFHEASLEKKFTYYQQSKDRLAYWANIPEEHRHFGIKTEHFHRPVFPVMWRVKECDGMTMQLKYMGTKYDPKVGNNINTELSRFTVMTPYEAATPIPNVSVWEIIDQRCYLAADIDFKLKSGEQGAAELHTVLECAKLVAKDYGIDMPISEWKICKSDVWKNKGSFHISNRNHVFPQWIEQEDFWKKVDALVYQAGFPNLDSDGNEIVNREFRSIIDNIYTRNRAMRCIGSAKIGKENTLRPVDLNLELITEYNAEDYLITCNRRVRRFSKFSKSKSFKYKTPIVGKGKGKRKRYRKYHKDGEGKNFIFIDLGDVIRLERMRESLCPIHNRKHENDNMVYNKKTKELYCFRGGRIKMEIEELLKL